MSISQPERFFYIHPRWWDLTNIKPLISLYPDRVFFISTTAALKKLNPQPQDIFITWGVNSHPEYESIAHQLGARFLRIEDGFIRSVGLGSDLIRPSSIIFDEKGIYFDPSKPSDLEEMLNNITFSNEDIQRAKKIRRTIVKNHVTKYNLETNQPLEVASTGKKIILVPGQVEDDASILLGAGKVKTNLDLLQAVRHVNADAYIIYKPHPDVSSRNRKGRVHRLDVMKYADLIEESASVVSCISASDQIHTMTSLVGFDALLRRKKVVTYGQPFYAGWGLTKDIFAEGAAFKRRHKKLTIDELVAGALIHYPIYWDWELRGYTTCEATIHHLVEERNRLESNGQLSRLRVGFVRRQFRKLNILLKNSFGKRM